MSAWQDNDQLAAGAAGELDSLPTLLGGPVVCVGYYSRSVSWPGCGAKIPSPERHLGIVG
jgi:hypothetical protein